MSTNTKAKETYQQAQKTLGKWSLFSSTKYDDAAELFQKAGNLFKSSNDFLEAADAYQRAAEIHKKIDNQNDCNNCYTNAAQCYRKAGKKDEAINIMSNVIDTHISNGKFNNAAKLCAELGDMSKEEGDYETAVKYYRDAINYYVNDNRPVAAQQLKSSVAEMLAFDSKYTEAAEEYEKIGMECINTGTSKWGAKEHFFNSVICHILNQDDIGAEQAIDRFEDVDPSVSSKRDYDFLKQFNIAVKNSDTDKMDQLLSTYTSIKKLDPTKKVLVERIKTRIQDAEKEVLL